MIPHAIHDNGTMTMFSKLAISVAVIVFTLLWHVQVGVALDIVRNGHPAATVVVEDRGHPTDNRGKRDNSRGDRQAANVLINWVAKITEAHLPIAAKAPVTGPTIYIGAAAIRAGLRVDDIESPSHEGLRIRCDNYRVLLAGQNDTATIKAVCRLLEQWGCRFFIDNPLGEVYPHTRTLTLDKLDLIEKPGMDMRRIWGSGWGGTSLWKIWNGESGIPMETGHSWGRYVSRDVFEKRPEYFALRDGQRRAGDWYCTSNSQLREVFAQGILKHIAAGEANPSISPPDGQGYCECNHCRAQDDPKSIELSSGHVSITNRYMDFYQDVGRRVARKQPLSVLSFYCYADYTEAPSREFPSILNLCPWIAPIRYCRYHHIDQVGCPSRVQLAELINGWAASSRRMGYRSYNYNLAECLVPCPLVSVWKHDIPYLRKKGCSGINLETLANWQIYAPHIYLSIRLAYDPGADAGAIMKDFFRKFYGLDAGALMEEYWMAIDRAFAELPCHSGGFYAVHLVYTPKFLHKCRNLISRAEQAAKDDAKYLQRIHIAAEGFKNAQQYTTLLGAINRGEFAAARRVYDQLLARCEQASQSKLGCRYTVTYLKRFLGTIIEAGEKMVPPGRVIAILPDRWRLAYDEGDEGFSKGYAERGFDDSTWREVATYSKTLDAQGLPDRFTLLWYRARFQTPPDGKKVRLVFLEIDGQSQVFANGKAVGGVQKARTPFEVDFSEAIKPGENTVAVRVDHKRMTELMLGGILRPVLLVHAVE
jgi:hypothetical protein